MGSNLTFQVVNAQGTDAMGGIHMKIQPLILNPTTSFMCNQMIGIAMSHHHQAVKKAGRARDSRISFVSSIRLI